MLAAEGLPWFAVLVADSGPLDRDWVHPALPGSHPAAHPGPVAGGPGRGLPALRQAHPFGSRDSSLDTSLDAQAGDVRAALAAARDLPEAKGRRLLLVGHGEGALLALLDARRCDALLLLAMPPQTMARSMPPSSSPSSRRTPRPPTWTSWRRCSRPSANRRPCPAPGPEVYPALAPAGRLRSWPRRPWTSCAPPWTWTPGPWPPGPSARWPWCGATGTCRPGSPPWSPRPSAARCWRSPGPTTCSSARPGPGRTGRRLGPGAATATRCPWPTWRRWPPG